VERLLLYLALAAAVALILLQLPRLRPQPDYCAEARRLTATILAVWAGGGSVTDAFDLRGVAVTPTGVSCAPCGVSASAPIESRLGSGELSGRWRLRIRYQGGKVVLEPA